MLPWIYRNICTQSYKTVRKKIEELYKEYKAIRDYVKKRVVKPIGVDLINLSKSVELTCLISKVHQSKLKNKQNYGELK